MNKPEAFRLSEAEATRMLEEADQRYRSFPHADLRVGRERYRAEVDTIRALSTERGL